MNVFYRTLPKKVRIGSYWVHIEVGESGDHETEGTFGHFNPVSQKIRVRPDLEAQKLANTFIHEVIHAMNSFSRAGVGAETWDEAEEDYTHKIANGLCTFFQDNKDAAHWWTAANDLNQRSGKLLLKMSEGLCEGGLSFCPPDTDATSKSSQKAKVVPK